jgi:hypothetical protein
MPVTMLKLATVTLGLLNSNSKIWHKRIAERLAKIPPLENVRFFNDASKRFICYLLATIYSRIGDGRKTSQNSRSVNETYGPSDICLSRGWSSLFLAYLYSGCNMEPETIVQLNIVLEIASRYDQPDLSRSAAIVALKFYSKVGRYQEAVDVIRAASEKYLPTESELGSRTSLESLRRNRYRFLCVALDLLYGVKHFLLAFDLASADCTKETGIYPRSVQEQQINELKVKIDRALRNPRDYNYCKENMPRVCAECWKVSSSRPKHSKCGGCRLIYYCGTECQNKHWPVHKKVCFKYPWIIKA